MLTVGATAAHAEEQLVVLADHLPLDVEVGRPLVAMGSDETGELRLVTSRGFWWVSIARAERLVVLDDGWTEFTRWRAGVEVSRVVRGLR